MQPPLPAGGAKSGGSQSSPTSTKPFPQVPPIPITSRPSFRQFPLSPSIPTLQWSGNGLPSQSSPGSRRPFPQQPSSVETSLKAKSKSAQRAVPSCVHESLQPSPGVVFPSSQSSPTSITPFPQRQIYNLIISGPSSISSFILVLKAAPISELLQASLQSGHLSITFGSVKSICKVAVPVFSSSGMLPEIKTPSSASVSEIAVA